MNYITTTGVEIHEYTWRADHFRENGGEKIYLPIVYGYARCSTNEDKQDINRQVRELKAAGTEQIFFEYEHGDTAVKERLSAILEAANCGDTILTLEVSRLA